MLELRAAVAVRGVLGIVGGVMAASIPACADDSLSMGFFLAVVIGAIFLMRLSEAVGDESKDLVALVVTTWGKSEPRTFLSEAFAAAVATASPAAA